ncbi:hypothetical protein NQ317_000318 [Molorchus minor]|uniref:Uncharacterized protein n=1 Tax=Molorchus minor TaxID=1323400 RepID=A0ABQ9J957_9CUCU|nr:hypothetical protein NQ317_000318 [Molorchus minor]
MLRKKLSALANHISFGLYQSSVQVNCTIDTIWPKEKYLCLNCLSSKHRISACKSTNTCQVCHLRHHSLLHFDNTNSASSGAAHSSSSHAHGSINPAVSNTNTQIVASSSNQFSSNENANENIHTFYSTSKIDKLENINKLVFGRQWESGAFYHNKMLSET